MRTHSDWHTANSRTRVGSHVRVRCARAPDGRHRQANGFATGRGPQTAAKVAIAAFATTYVPRSLLRNPAGRPTQNKNLRNLRNLRMFVSAVRAKKGPRKGHVPGGQRTPCFSGSDWICTSDPAAGTRSGPPSIHAGGGRSVVRRNPPCGQFPVQTRPRGSR
jgi:hypothetical protein